MASKVINRTEEEREQDKQKVLEWFQEGLPMRRMAANLGVSSYYIKKIRERLIQEDLITREEIDVAYNKYMAENPPAQGLDKSKARPKSNTEKADARHARAVAKKERTFELIKQKKSIIEMAKELQVSDTAITYYMKQLIDEGRIEKDEVDKVPRGKISSQIDKTSPEYLAQRDEFVRYLRMGWKSFAIRKVLGITVFYSNIYISDIKASGIMTAEEIEQAKAQKRQADLAELEEHLKNGYSKDAFRELHPEFTYNDVTPLAKELVDQGKVTREQVEQDRKRNVAKTLNKNVSMSPEEQLKFIIKKVKKGYTPQEIVDSDKTKSLTMHKVLFQKRQIIAKGIISQKEADLAMAKRQSQKLEIKHGKAIDRVRELTMQGFSLQEISEKSGYTYSYLSCLKNKEAKENGWFTNEELKEFKTQRKIREYESLPQEEKDRLEQEKKAQEERIETEKSKGRKLSWQEERLEKIKHKQSIKQD